MTERLHFHFSLSCIGAGNDNPFQYSCLENPGEGGIPVRDVWDAAETSLSVRKAVWREADKSAVWTRTAADHGQS